MGFISFIKKLLKFGKQDDLHPTIYFREENKIEEIHSVWDYIKIAENTQAYHLANTIGFDEWIEMDEIRRRIAQLFGVQYKNERSLYPYLKTMSDMGLFETVSVGGRRKWRKKDLLIRIEKKAEQKEKEGAKAVAK